MCNRCVSVLDTFRSCICWRLRQNFHIVVVYFSLHMLLLLFQLPLFLFPNCGTRVAGQLNHVDCLMHLLHALLASVALPLQLCTCRGTRRLCLCCCSFCDAASVADSARMGSCCCCFVAIAASCDTNCPNRDQLSSASSAPLAPLSAADWLLPELTPRQAAPPSSKPSTPSSSSSPEGTK